MSFGFALRMQQMFNRDSDSGQKSAGVHDCTLRERVAEKKSNESTASHTMAYTDRRQLKAA
jgi:hypothetical protein